ncbi:MAG: hypothetical protein IJC73_01650 [Lentisphaeria bacterium]|nr:hypothetical protein [Lentisphaeria bacterium]
MFYIFTFQFWLIGLNLALQPAKIKPTALFVKFTAGGGDFVIQSGDIAVAAPEILKFLIGGTLAAAISFSI